MSGDCRRGLRLRGNCERKACEVVRVPRLEDDDIPKRLSHAFASLAGCQLRFAYVGQLGTLRVAPSTIGWHPMANGGWSWKSLKMLVRLQRQMLLLLHVLSGRGCIHTYYAMWLARCGEMK
jgi:hypothetical protein